MLETIGDYLSIGILIFFVLWGIYLFYVISVKHNERILKSIESRYYRYYDDVDEDEFDDSNAPYYED